MRDNKNRSVPIEMLCQVYNKTSFHEQIMQERLEQVNMHLRERKLNKHLIPEDYIRMIIEKHNQIHPANENLEQESLEQEMLLGILDRTTRDYLNMREKLVHTNSLTQQYDNKNEKLESHCQKYTNLKGEATVQLAELEQQVGKFLNLSMTRIKS